MPYDSKAVANYFLQLAEKEGKKLTPMQAIKLVYVGHGWHLAITGKPLIEEQVEAWKWGPVVPDVYHEFKRFGSGPITDRAMRITWQPGDEYSVRYPQIPDDDESTRHILDRTWKVYSKFTGSQLMSMTHQRGTPWFTVWHEQGGKERRHKDIPDELIQTHFRDKATKVKAGG